MTTPTEIYADMDLRHQSQGMWECVPFTIHPDSPRYIRADIADAAVQAAVAKAVDAERGACADEVCRQYKLWEEFGAAGFDDLCLSVIPAAIRSRGVAG